MHTEIVHSSFKNMPVRLMPTHDPLQYPPAEIGESFCAMHLHDEIEILLSTYGDVGVRVAGREFVLKPGEAVLVKSRIPHQTYAACEYSSHCAIQFQPDLLEETPNSGKYLSRFINSGDAHIFHIGDPVTAELTGYINAMFEEYSEKKPSYELYIKANIQLILGCFYRNSILNNSDNFFNSHEISKIMPLLKYIDENYSEPITLEQAGKILSLNRDYFCRLFRKATNMTFTEYLNYVRICHTETPLTFSDKSISEISLDAGFSSVSYFNRVFKKYKLITPSEYRRSKYAEA